MRVIWSTPALADVRSHALHLARVNEIAARDLAAALFAAGDSLCFMPFRGRRGRILGTRELFACPPYVIVYQVSQDTVEILRVRHGRLIV